MSWTIILPVIYLFIGYLNGYFKLGLTKVASALLLNFLVPLSVVYYLSSSHKGDLLLIATMPVFMLWSSVIYFFVLRKWGSNFPNFLLKTGPKDLSNDPSTNELLLRIRILITTGPNVGWFGMPIALALFGEKGGLVFAGLYIGNSLLFNSYGVALITSRGLLNLIIAIIKTPTFIALVIGVALMPYGSYIEEKFADYIGYLITVVGFFGMFITGSFIYGVKWSKDLLIQENYNFMFKLLVYGAMMVLTYEVALYFNQAWFTDNFKIIFLITLLPYASGGINLETYYLKSTHSVIPVANSTLISLFWIALYAIAILI